VPERDQGLVQIHHGLAIGGARGRLRSRLTEIPEGPLPELAADRMVGQPLDLLCESIAMDHLDGGHQAGMESAPPLTEQAPIRHLVGEGVLERVLQLREEARFIEELRRLQAGEPGAERLVG
jgi:hypothetical protein